MYRNSQIIKTFFPLSLSSDIRPSVHLPYHSGRVWSGRVVARNGICVAPGRSRPPPPGSRALISVHPASLLGGCRAPSAHTSVSRAARCDFATADTRAVGFLARRSLPHDTRSIARELKL